MNILWNFTIQTDREINCRRPDITVHDKNNNNFLSKDIAVPGDRNVESKLRERELGKISRLSKGKDKINTSRCRSPRSDTKEPTGSLERNWNSK